MTADFGKGFTVTNLKYMRQFYLTFPNGHALRGELSWTHYRLLMKVENEKARQFYLDECVKSGWSTRQLERQINSFFYERLLSSRDKEGVAAEIQKLEPGKAPASTKAIWSRRSSIICRNSCWSWGAASHSWPDRSVSLLTGSTSSSILYFTIIF